MVIPGCVHSHVIPEKAPPLLLSQACQAMDHLIYDDCVCNPFLNDLVIDFDDEPGIDSTARDSDQSKFPRLFHTCDG